jgi:hypothetical protein
VVVVVFQIFGKEAIAIISVAMSLAKTISRLLLGAEKMNIVRVVFLASHHAHSRCSRSYRLARVRVLAAGSCGSVDCF